MPELSEEQRARLAAQALEQADQVLTEKEESAPGFRAPEKAPLPVSELPAPSAPSIEQTLAKKPSAAETLTDEEQKRIADANLLLARGKSLEEVMARFGNFFNAVESLGSKIPGDKE